ncbi:hypothetical protein LY90DRAFT_499536 [Neocallimastix californiae]|uniref:F-box domain-containing protein n=1 Tax=Neocallimastix californiae TaxID=1754190 RepID=A0A1Y2FIZ2_9FUNG|nr:hypothetical protein LY90DRAFT_499536 [Neocallimastix californiae]|eukprot:ORY83344.1 hypothetical protein LY90DRAFT_499536 [Neocallimastix californiae]
MAAGRFSLQLDLDLGSDIQFDKDLDLIILRNNSSSTIVTVSKYLSDRYRVDNGKQDNNISSLLNKVGDFFLKKSNDQIKDNSIFVPTSTSDMPSAVIMNILLNMKSSNDLFNASLVCKRWASIALPLLYSKIHIKNENNFKICLKMKKCNKVCQLCTNNVYTPIPSKYKGLIQELVVSISHIDMNKLLPESSSTYFPIHKSSNKQRLSLQSTLSSSSYLSNSSSTKLNSRRDSEISIAIGSSDITLPSSSSTRAMKRSSVNSVMSSSRLQGNYSFQSDQFFEEHIIHCAIGGNLKVLKLVNISLPNLNTMLKYIPPKQLKHLEITTIHKRMTLEIDSFLNYLKHCDSLNYLGLGFCTDHCSCWYDDNAKSLMARLVKSLPSHIKSLRFFCSNMVTRDTMVTISHKCQNLEKLDLTEAWFELEDEEEEEENNDMNHSFKKSLNGNYNELEQEQKEKEENSENSLTTITSCGTTKKTSKKSFKFSNLKYFGCRGSGGLATTKTVLNIIRSAPKLCNLNLDSPNEMTPMNSNLIQTNAGRRSISINSNLSNRISANSNSKFITSSDLTLKFFETILTNGNTENWKSLFLGPHLRSCSLGNLHCIALFSQLEVLQLSWVADDTLLNEITEQCRNLKILDISYSSVTDKGLKKTFIDNGYGKHLEWLGIHSCKQITNEGKLLLVSEMPKLYGILTEKVALYWINNHFELRGWRGMNGYKQKNNNNQK